MFLTWFFERTIVEVMNKAPYPHPVLSARLHTDHQMHTRVGQRDPYHSNIGGHPKAQTNNRTDKGRRREMLRNLIPTRAGGPHIAAQKVIQCQCLVMSYVLRVSWQLWPAFVK